MTPGNSFVQGDQSLLDALDRLARAPEGCRAAYLSLSRLRARNRTSLRARFAAHLFTPLVSGYGCDVFLLSNGDQVILGRGVPATTLETHMERARALFRTDPGSRAEAADGTDLFATLYDLEHDGRALRDRIEAVRGARVDPWRVINRNQPAENRPLTPRVLLQVAEGLTKLDPRPLIRRQPVIRIDSDRRGRFLYEEFFVALSEVRRQCAPDINLAENRWLFQEVCRLLDPRIIAAIGRLAPRVPGGTIGINLNVETVLGLGLDAVLASLPRGARLIVEIRVIDAFTNLDRLPEAAARLRAEGHSLVLDGVTPHTLALIDPARLDVDLVKLTWDMDLADPRAVWDGPHPRVLIRALGPDRVILSRVENEKALLWGLSQGIRAFQGFFVDRVVGATTMAACPKRELCTLAQCVDRRRAVAGPIRASCPHPPGLDAVEELRALPGRLMGEAAVPAMASGGAGRGGAHG